MNIIDSGLKFVDVYKSDKKFNMSEDQSDKINRNQDKVGSKVGGSFSLFLIFLCIYQFVYQMVRMHQGLEDNQIFRSRTNHLRDGENIIDIANS